MRIVIYGAGGVGGTIGARLHQRGYDVVLVARGAHLGALQSAGLDLVAPDGKFNFAIPAVAHPRDLTLQSDDVVVMAMKSQHTADALDQLALCAPDDIAIVCAQNGVANEATALRRFARVYGMLVHLPAMHLQPGLVVTHASGCGGVLDTGCYPHGQDAFCETFTKALREAGFSAVADPAVMRLKYAKLLMNLNNALQAAVTMGPDTRAISRALRQEALACFAAAGIDCATVDEVRARLDGVYEMAEVPGYPRGGGSSWQSLVRGTGNIETDFLNGEIVLLGRLHGVPTPVNETCQRLARRMIGDGVAPGSLSAAEVNAMIDECQSGRVQTGITRG